MTSPSSISSLLVHSFPFTGVIVYFPFAVLMVRTLLLTVSHHLKGFVKEIFDAPSTSSDHPDSCYDDTFFLPFTLSVHLSFPFLSAALTLLDHVTLLFKVQVMWHDITGALVPIKGPGFHRIPGHSMGFYFLPCDVIPLRLFGHFSVVYIGHLYRVYRPRIDLV